MVASLSHPSTRDGVPSPMPERASVLRFLPYVLQLALAVVVVHVYAIEGPGFAKVLLLAMGGFVANLFIPRRYRLPSFVVLSLAGVFLVFGLADGAWLVGCGLVILLVCHLPVPMVARVLALLALGGGLAASRGGLIPAPWSAGIWPILGSMFMFRLVLYMMALRKAQPGTGFLNGVAYFFMLPNLVFPLFPVVDYQTFQRTYYDREEGGIYQQGLQWIARGLVHLLLYRLVYHAVLNDPVEVATLGDLLQLMLGTFLLYLRVSGQFHLVVGVLHLFGFRLPETHKLYYLAHSFTELWRRINIYWTDFMMKAVFYPTYFQVKQLGPARALTLATVAVFVTTWVLHSYQWFWLRGGFPITPQDLLFWSALGGLVVVGALKELRTTRKPKLGTSGWDWRFGLKAVATFGLFCLLWSLWSIDSVGRWIWMLGAALNVDIKGVVLLVVSFTTIFVLGGRNWESRRSPRSRWVEFALMPAVRTTATLVLLLFLAQPVLRGMVPDAMADGLRALQATGLNARDAAVQHRGYYEQLDLRAQVTAQVFDVIGQRDDDWEDLSQLGVLRSRRDLMLRELLPSRHVLWNGNAFSTNRWGMRDREYAREKGAETLRIALLGPSHVMGNGVADGATFESLVEERLNREFRYGRYRRVEILNFGVDGYSLPQQVAMLADRVFQFEPDVVIATHYQSNRAMTEGFLTKVVWQDIAVTDGRLEALLTRVGLDDKGHGGIPVPFAAGRKLARWFGVEARMPSVEAESRIRWISNDVLEWSLRRFAETTRSHGAVPVVLALNTVIDNVAPEVPNRLLIEQLGVPLIDLFDVFPEAERPSLRVAPWDDHPNAAAHQLVAERVYESIVTLLDSGEFVRRSGRRGPPVGRWEVLTHGHDSRPRQAIRAR